MEQKALFVDTTVCRQGEAVVRLSSPPPPTFQPSCPLPRTANLAEQEELLSATPQLARTAACLVRRESDKSFVQTEVRDAP